MYKKIIIEDTKIDSITHETRPTIINLDSGAVFCDGDQSSAYDQYLAWLDDGNEPEVEVVSMI